MMSPRKLVTQVSGDTGITVRVLMAVLVFMFTVISTVGGVTVTGIIKMTNMERDIEAVRVQIENTHDTIAVEMAGQFKAVSAEITRRTASRWTERDMAVLQRATEQCLRASGIDITLPDPFTIEND